MHPALSLDAADVAANCRAWRAFAGVPVRPVIKNDGYGWGVKTLVSVLDSECDAYCVSDLEELHAARLHTARPIVLLSRIPASQLHEALDAGGIPTLETADDIARCVQWKEERGTNVRARIGLRPAAGWSGIDLSALDALTLPLARAAFDLEVWTHVTDPSLHARQQARVEQAVRVLRDAGVRVRGVDVSSTMALARDGACGQSVRVGVGLFGATGGPDVPGVRCAVRVSAPVTRCDFLRGGERVGYGTRKLEQDGYVLTARCGYGDGLPKGLTGTSDILSVGMQYVALRAGTGVEPGTAVSLIDEKTNLDKLAAAAGIGTHELITALGNAAQRMNAATRNR